MKLSARIKSRTSLVILALTAIGAGISLSPVTVCAVVGPSPRHGYPGLHGVEISNHKKDGSLHILFFGDSGTGTHDQYEVGRVMNQICVHRGCDLALQLGDNIYEDGIENVEDQKLQTHFELPYEAFGRFDFWTIAGNHDWRGDVAAEIAYTPKSPRWRMPDYHYGIPRLPSWIRIYGFDTDKISASQAEAAKPYLCDPKAKWKIAFGHHPIHSNGQHGDSEETAKVLLPLFKECGVQLYLSGHDHHQEHITGRIFEQVVSGAAAKLRDVNQVPYKEGDDHRQNFARSALGFGILHITGQRLEIEFYDDRGRELYSWETTPSEYGLEKR